MPAKDFMQSYDFVPVDTLFCRDGRPLAAGSGFGHGANWPLPNTLHEALRAGLLRLAGIDAIKGKTETVSKVKNGKIFRNKVGTTGFDWLHIRGPFPVDAAGELWFPTPRDIALHYDDAGKSWAVRHQLIPARNGVAETNLPAALQFMLANDARPGKEDLPQWMPTKLYADYLAGNAIETWRTPELWDTEYRIGIGIKPDSHSTEESKIYASEHLRLRDDVRLRFIVNLPKDSQRRQDEDGKTVADLLGLSLTLGGERRFGVLREASDAFEMPEAGAKLSGLLIKWVLLSPAIFTGGWLPGWIKEEARTLKVMLTVLPPEDDYRALRTREERRGAMHAAAQPINASLVAACIGKPQPVVGWDLLHKFAEANGTSHFGGAKPTQLAVPSGSVFYFRASDETAARQLVTTLQGRCRSDFFGEKGLGLGVCGTCVGQAQTSMDVFAPEKALSGS